jgi:tight adherence protein B
MNRLPAALALAVVVVAGAASVAAAATVQATPASARFPFRSYVLTAPPGVTLNAKTLRVTENGVPVSDLTVSSAANAQSGKFGVVLAIDTSDSMAGRPIAAAVDAARVFAAQRPATEAVGIITFNSGVGVPLGLTTKQNDIDAALATTPKLAYGTHIYGAVARALKMIEAAKLTSGTIVLLSDGADTGSRVTAAQAISQARSAHVRVFTIGSRSKVFQPAALRGLAVGTGGAFSTADTSAQLKQVYSGLGNRLSHEYLLQYRSLASPSQQVNVKISIAGAQLPAVDHYTTPPLPQASLPFHSNLADRLWGSTIAMVAFALICALLLGVGLWALFRPAPRTLQGRVAEFVSLYTPRENAKRKSDPSAISGVERSFRRSSRWRRFTDDLEIADIALTPFQILLGTAVLTVLGMFLISAILGSTIFAIFALGIPIFAYNSIKARLARRRRLFSEQLPDTLQVLASALRAGHTLIGALAVVSSEAPEPTRAEMRRVVADEQFGVPLEEALDRVASRMASTEFEQVSVVAGLQREAGGNVAEVLDRVGHSVRERIEVRQLVRSLTAQGRLSRWLLTLLPPGLGVIVAFIDPGYLDPLFHKTSGQVILILAGIMVVAGSLAIKKIVEIEI